jgi:bifunctional DNase/RNase
MPAHFPPCDGCGRPCHASTYDVAGRQVITQRHFCRGHFSHAEPVSSGPHTGIIGDFAKYALTRLYFSYDEDRYCFRLDTCENSGRCLYIETGFIELSLIYHSLDRTLPTPTTHKLLLSLAQGVLLTVSRVVLDDFDAGSRTFAAKVILTGERCIQLDCRVSDAVALAMVSGCDIHVIRKVEQAFYSNYPPEQSNS